MKMPAQVPVIVSLPLHKLVRCTAAGGVLLAAACLTHAAVQSAAADPASMDYRMPPQPIRELFDLPDEPLAQISQDNRWLVITERDRDEKSIEELAEPILMLAGQRFNPRPNGRAKAGRIRKVTVTSIDGSIERNALPPPNGRICDVAWPRDSSDAIAYSAVTEGVMSLHLLDLTKGIDRRVAAPGMTGRIDSLTFSRDGRHLAFSAATPDGVILWIADVPTATAEPVYGVRLNHVNRKLEWANGGPPLLCFAEEAGRGAPPAAPEVPSGPIVQESSGRLAAVRTFQDTLKSPHDEALFVHYATAQLIAVHPRGTVTPIGPPDLYTNVTPSPDGDYLLTTALRRPFSYQVPSSRFPSRTVVRAKDGREIKVVAESSLQDHTDPARDAVVPGVRLITWRPDAAATLMLVESLDDRDPPPPGTNRDRVSLLSAPFSGEPSRFVEFELRYGGIQWAFPDLALVTERLSSAARTRTWIVNPSDPKVERRLLWDRGTEDRYADPGHWVLTPDPAGPRQIPLRSSDGRWLYLIGAGAAPTGARPFHRNGCSRPSRATAARSDTCCFRLKIII